MNNVFGVVGIKAKNANWNAGWDKFPKQLSDGTIYGSDKALKYAMRNYWHMQGENVLYFKSHKNEKDVIQPLSLSERYERIFKKSVKKSSHEEVLTNILSTTDCRQFGFTFAEQGCNLNQTGVVQIGIGLNIYGNTSIEIQKILSPFRNANKENANQSSGGEIMFVDEAHYCYPFSINPAQINEILDTISPYDEKDYLDFIKAAANCADALNTCAKIGCSNEYLILVETRDDLYLNNLSEFITLKDNYLNLDNMITYLEKYKDRVVSIKIYYNKDSIKIGNYEVIEKHEFSELR